MKSPAQRWAVVVLVVVVGLGIAGWAMLANRGNPPQDAEQAQAKPGDADEAADADHVMVGGVRRKRSDIEPAKRPARDPSEKAARDPFDYGQIPPVKSDANPQVEAVAVAIREGKHPERVSVLMRGAAFNPETYEANPREYLDIVEPARVFQTAQPGPGVPRLQPASDYLTQISQGQSTKLRVQAPAGCPVTFTSFDAGRFENQLASITVQAGPKGVAEAEFFATPGVIENVNILAGAPLASGQVKFVVHVSLPDDGVAVVPIAGE